ncbi:MAG: hypothetical protein K2X32_14220 [Phycisphaerales bacterium]|nr:hypothetical protein [Phycisphaerales bacterium]MBY0263317.1 hypothetical protein [Phycisphaerales bacterium]
MAGSSTNLNLVTANTGGGSAQANALFDAASPGMLFGRNSVLSTALTWAWYGGAVLLAGAPTVLANGSVALTPSRTQNIEAGPVSNTTAPITGVSIANPCVINSAAHPFFPGDVVWIDGIVGTTQLNGSFARVTATAANTVTLAVDSTGFTAWTSGGTLARMTDAGAYTLRVGKGLGTAFVAQSPLYNVVASFATVSSWTDFRLLAAPAGPGCAYGGAAQSVAGAVDVIASQAAFAAARAAFVDLTGAITANIAYIVPRLSGPLTIRNSATGAFALTVRPPGGTGVVVAAGATVRLNCDGTNVVAIT